MDFLKKNWASLILIGIVATYLGISMATERCPLCLVSDAVSHHAAPGQVDHASGGVSDQPALVKDWTAETLQGQPLRSSELEGKVTVLVYWATWCAPCLEEIPSLVEVRRRFPIDEVEMIGVSVDESLDSLERFVKERTDINYAIARNNDSLTEAFGYVRFIPTMILVDRNGYERSRHSGVIGSGVIKKQIQALLNDESLPEVISSKEP